MADSICVIESNCWSVIGRILLGGLPAGCACWNAYFSLVSAAPGYPDTAVGLFHAQFEKLKEYSDKKCNPNK